MVDERFIPRGVACPTDLTAEAVESLARQLVSRADPVTTVEDMLRLVEPLAEIARRWLAPGDPIRCEALDRLPGRSSFPRTMWEAALEAMFAPITEERLTRFVEEELGRKRLAGHRAIGPHPGPLPARERGTRPGPGLPPERRKGRSGSTDGPLEFPRLIGQVLAGNVPAPVVQTIFCGFLTGAGQLVKTAAEDQLFPVLLARSVRAVAPELAVRLAVVHWPGRSEDHNLALARQADVICAFGRSDSLASWRALTGRLGRRGPRLLAHGPRTAAELIELPASATESRKLAEAVAFDAALYDQQGCLSPQQVCLADGVARSARGRRGLARCERFARQLADALSQRAARWPIAARDLGQKLAIRRARESALMQMLLSAGNRGGSTAVGRDAPCLLLGPEDRFDWTLIGEQGNGPRIGPGGRTLFLTRVDSLDAAVDAIAPMADWIQGIALHAAERVRLAERIAGELKIPYVCRPGQLQRPPFGWRNDNVPPLRALLSE